MLPHAFADDLLTFGINTRWITTAMRLGGTTACTAKARDEFPHKPRADGKALGELPYRAFVMLIRQQNLLAQI
jgi:hypothetical protein